MKRSESHQMAGEVMGRLCPTARQVFLLCGEVLSEEQLKKCSEGASGASPSGCPAADPEHLEALAEISQVRRTAIAAGLARRARDVAELPYNAPPLPY